MLEATMSQRPPTDQTAASMSLVAFRATGDGDGGSRRRADHGEDDPQGPWWFFALLAVGIAAVVLLVHTRPLPGQ